MTTLETIRTILVRLDPEGLIKLGAPADEYDSEAATLADAVARGVPITPQYVRDVWLYWFGCADVLTGEGLDQTPKTKMVYEMPHRPVFDEIAEAIGSSPARTKMTVLDGYYASGRYDDGFVFDTHHPDYDHGADLREWTKTHDNVEECPEEFFHDGCCVFPTALLPEESKGRKGRWTITVTFEPVE